MVNASQISTTANVTTAIDPVARYRQLARLSFRAFIARGLTARIAPDRSLRRTDLGQCLVSASQKLVAKSFKSRNRRRQVPGTSDASKTQSGLTGHLVCQRIGEN